MILNKFLKALYVSFLSIFFYSIFVLPLKLWMGSIDFLANQSDINNTFKSYATSEMKVLSWLSLFFHSLIFICYILGIGLIVSLFFKGFNIDEIKNKSIFIIISFYLLPVVLSFLKEILSLKLLTYFKLENIEENNKQKSC